MKLTPFVLFGWILFITACSPKYQSFTGNYQFTASAPGGAPDYARLDFWAAHPYKKDPSDSVPKPLRASYRPDSTADVFFIHPTTYTQEEKKFGWNGPVDDAELNAKTDYSTILSQASVFNEVGRIYAPRYRQAHLSAYYPKNAADSQQAKNALDLAYADVKAAFQYYLQYENKGRPIIIASHSQGSTHAQRLLLEFFENQLLYNKLVVAYIPGMYVNPDKFKQITTCQLPYQTGCMVGWRTYQEGYTPEFIQKEPTRALIVNPLTWDSNKPEAGKEANKGAVLYNFNKVIKNTTAANVHENLLWTPRPSFFGSFLYRTKNYHVADYNLYYVSVRENAQLRLSAFWKR